MKLFNLVCLAHPAIETVKSRANPHQSPSNTLSFISGPRAAAYGVGWPPNRPAAAGCEPLAAKNLILSAAACKEILHPFGVQNDKAIIGGGFVSTYRLSSTTLSF